MLYLMDTWPLGMGSDEKIVRGIRPDVALWDLYGYYPLPSDPGVHVDKPVRYVLPTGASGLDASHNAPTLLTSL